MPSFEDVATPAGDLWTVLGTDGPETIYAGFFADPVKIYARGGRDRVFGSDQRRRASTAAPAATPAPAGPAATGSCLWRRSSGSRIAGRVPAWTRSSTLCTAARRRRDPGGPHAR